ncbi:MAG: hypothetical protein NXI32_04950 [bacterium]|nr:hypothetical protein [bacterium]
MSTVQVDKFSDLVQHGPAVILNLFDKQIVRTLTKLEDGQVYLLAGDGTKMILEGDTPIRFQPWVMDRGSLLFEVGGHELKICTESDILRTEDGRYFSIEPTEAALEEGIANLK